MSLKNVVAIVRENILGNILNQLQDIGVTGASITQVKGYGEYINTYSRDVVDSLSNNVRIDIILPEERVETIVEAILEAASTGGAGDGIVSISDINALYRVRDKQKM